MTWKVFGGRNHDIYLALLKQRCLDAGLPTDDETLAQQLRLHLHRGIGYLKGDPAMRDIRALIRSGLSPQG
jgi:DNA sulfur modification protein DndE